MTKFAALFDFPGAKPSGDRTQEQILLAHAQQQDHLALTETSPKIAGHHRLSAERSRERILVIQAKRLKAA